MMTQWIIPEHAPVMVVWSPRHQRYIASITTRDYRYDAYILPHEFVFDPVLQVPENFGPAYYLARATDAAHRQSKNAT